MLDIIKDNNPLLIVYPTGAGGEFISMTIANNSSNFNNLKYQYRSDNNQIHTHSPIKYTSMWSENDSNTLIDNTVILKDNYLRNVLKDHPSIKGCNLYKKFIPSVEILYISPVKEVKYFSTLAFAKLAELVKTPIDKEYFFNYVNSNIIEENFNKILNLTSGFPQIWKHEIDILNTELSMDNNVEFKHEPSLSIHILNLELWTNKVLHEILPIYKKTFKKFTFINIDTLINSSENFWKQIKIIIPDINLSIVTASTDAWIKNNNTQCEKFIKQFKDV